MNKGVRIELPLLLDSFEQVFFFFLPRRRVSPHVLVTDAGDLAEPTHNSPGYFGATLACVTGGSLVAYVSHFTVIHLCMDRKTHFSDGLKIDVAILAKFPGVLTGKTHEKYRQPQESAREGV